jgi:hypothetical protein
MEIPMSLKQFHRLLPLLLIAGIIGCTSPGNDAEEIGSWPVNDLEGIISQNKVAFDATESHDGDGSIRIFASEPMSVRLYESGDLDVENVMLVYQATVKSENLEGMAYLEMWCVFEDGKEFFSRGLNSPWTGSIPWSVVETPFFLKAGQNPVNIRLNLVVDGTGTVWIDEMRLLKSPLNM